jgi:hypothetical protein
VPLACPVARLETVRYPRSGLAGLGQARLLRGRSSMAEPQPSKLVMRVRFPSPALTAPAQVKVMIIGF